MASITGSVGKNGNNDFLDSVTVQGLLNNFIAYGWVKKPNGSKVQMLKIDGSPGTKTKDAIEYFQLSYMSEIGTCKLRTIEPHSDTFARLNKTPAPPKGPYGGACPTLPDRPDLDDPKNDPHVVYWYDQSIYHASGICRAMSSKWLHLRGAGKDFLYDPVTRVGAPPSSDVYYAQDMAKLDGPDFSEEDFIASLAQFRLNKSTPEFWWNQSEVGVQGGTWAAHLVARHAGRFLHRMWPAEIGPGHAVAYEVTYKSGKAVMRLFDANVGHWLVHSGSMFVSVCSEIFRNMGYATDFNGYHSVVRVKSF